LSGKLTRLRKQTYKKLSDDLKQASIGAHKGKVSSTSAIRGGAELKALKPPRLFIFNANNVI
jgi:hypothetical protein